MIGSFITVEGMDGSGKSTITKHMGEFLTQMGVPNVVVEAYPRDEDSMFLRDLWIQQKVPDIAVLAIIMELRRRVTIAQIIPALLEGKVVISDRWHDTTWAYQHYGMGLRHDVMESVMKQAFDLTDALKPYDIYTRLWIKEQITRYSTIHLDIGLEASRQRVGVRTAAKDAFEKAPDEFFLKLNEGYKKLYRDRKHTPAGPLYFLDARGSIEDVKEKVERILTYVKTPVTPSA